MKICFNEKCFFGGKFQSIDNFSRDKVKKDGYFSVCKTCIKERYQKNRQQFLDQKKRYYQLKAGEIKQQKKQYYQSHKEERQKYNKNYQQIHKEELNEYYKQYYQDHKEQKLQYGKQYSKDHSVQRNLRRGRRKKEDLNFRIKCNLASRLSKSIKGNYKVGSAIRDMCCSIDEMFKLFELMYDNNPLHPILGKMCRENYGVVNGIFGWEVDHIVPLSSFDLTDRAQLLKAVHYSNLRPMWASQNRSEKDRGMSRNKRDLEKTSPIYIYSNTSACKIR